jgi:hypothetical protein
MKECFGCKKTKPLSGFYKHKQMKDGTLNKCIDCKKADSLAHREKNIHLVRAYDRKRGSRMRPGYLKEYRERFPRKYAAHIAVRGAIRAGKLFHEPCVVCGELKTVAHHDDYCKPLNVRWMCQACHKQWHAKNGGGKNP